MNKTSFGVSGDSIKNQITNWLHRKGYTYTDILTVDDLEELLEDFYKEFK